MLAYQIDIYIYGNERTDSMRTLAIWSVRHRRRVVVLWLLALVAATLAARAAGSAYSNSFSLAELTLLIGLGVGVDYALFIVTRHRQGLRAGRDVESSIATAVNTSGRAVLFAGITVCIALLGMFALGVSLLDGLVVAAAIGVACTMLAALTLLPALLGFIGTRVLSRRQRRFPRTTGMRQGASRQSASGLGGPAANG
jgi:uncharacterized membrane protein YdfJ with MMPL/SSD domain